MKKATKLNTAYEGEGKTFVLNLAEAELDGFGEAVKSMKELLDKTTMLTEKE